MQQRKRQMRARHHDLQGSIGSCSKEGERLTACPWWPSGAHPVGPAAAALGGLGDATAPARGGRGGLPDRGPRRQVTYTGITLRAAGIRVSFNVHRTRLRRASKTSPRTWAKYVLARARGAEGSCGGRTRNMEEWTVEFALLGGEGAGGWRRDEAGGRAARRRPRRRRSRRGAGSFAAGGRPPGGRKRAAGTWPPLTPREVQPKVRDSHRTASQRPGTPRLGMGVGEGETRWSRWNPPAATWNLVEEAGPQPGFVVSCPVAASNLRQDRHRRGHVHFSRSWTVCTPRCPAACPAQEMTPSSPQPSPHCPCASAAMLMLTTDVRPSVVLVGAAATQGSETRESTEVRGTAAPRHPPGTCTGTCRTLAQLPAAGLPQRYPFAGAHATSDPGPIVPSSGPLLSPPVPPHSFPFPPGPVHLPPPTQFFSSPSSFLLLLLALLHLSVASLVGRCPLAIRHHHAQLLLIHLAPATAYIYARRRAPGPA
ncbi:hypothetical protein Purlil1_12291 [Purpureocillium lilacinum]|uniref:Uncharacterized protein n=1 Tax=Purpureocillium lilacinum TaxID=33203 RepID=A0ABR0BHE7_PURLI|nr:hypothetical protein Purlil1_12291 [Purpureocillium lilacinum]